jgi:hypothetical protein
MSASFRRFEILLPRRFNDGTAVPDGLIADTLLELEERFGAVSCETQSIRGLWRHEDQLFRDELIRVLVDTSDAVENREFFLKFKERLKVSFRQLDIWLTTYPIDVL